MARFCYAARFRSTARARMDVALLIFLILLNALFAMSEMALDRQPQGAAAGDGGGRRCRRPGGDGPARQPDQVPLGGADRHHLDRRAQRHRRRRGLFGAVRASGCTRPSASTTARPTSPPPRWWWSSSPSSPSSSASWCPSGVGQMYPETVARLVSRPMEWLSIDRAAVRAAADVVHRSHAAPAGHPRRARPQRDGRRDRRQPRRRPGRRRDRGAGAPDGAQRVPPRRPPGRLDDDPARRDRLARRGRHA